MPHIVVPWECYFEWQLLPASEKFRLPYTGIPNSKKASTCCKSKENGFFEFFIKNEGIPSTNVQ